MSSSVSGCGCAAKSAQATAQTTTTTAWASSGTPGPSTAVRQPVRTCNTCQKQNCCTQCCQTPVAQACATPKEMCPSAPTGNPKFKYSLKVFNSFNMPACGVGVEMSVGPDVLWVEVGSVMWNRTVGYLHVTAFSKDRQSVTAENLCEQENTLNAGEAVPACTEFIITAPWPGSIGAQNANGPYLAADFTAQGPGECWPIQVTTVDGLSVNDSVGIKGYIYRVKAIPNLSTIEICDDNNGAPLYTLVEADANNDGVKDLPIIRLGGSDPCSKTGTNKGVLLVCDNGAQLPLEGTIDGHFPRWNEYYGRFELAVFPNSLLARCTTLVGCCLTLDPANTGCYLIKVESTEAFTDLVFSPVMLTINNENYVLCAIIDSEYMTVKPLFEVTEIREIPGGAVVCVDDCCNQCQPSVETLGRFGEAETGKVELLIDVPDTQVAVAANSTYMLILPTSIPYTSPGVNDGLWTLNYNNANSVDRCHKEITVHSNFEIAVVIPEDVYANVEYRLVKGGNLANSQAGAAMPMAGGRALLPAPIPNTPNLLFVDPAFKTINTFKGYLVDRGFVQGEGSDNQASDDTSTVRWDGHLRIACENTTAAAITLRVRGSLRVWFDVKRMGLTING